MNNNKKNVNKALIYFFVALILFYIVIIFFRKDSGIDFTIFYAASHLALTGQPEQIYNVEAHHIIVESVLGKDLPFLLGWFYPPVFLFLILPLAVFPYYYSLLVWILLTLYMYAITVCRIAPHKSTVFLSLAFPGVFMNVFWGQNGFLTAFLLGNGLLFIETNPMLSGLMFALLCYKPQFAFLPFLALLAGRHWRVLFWSCIFICLMVLMSIVAFGPGVWEEYIKTIPANASIIQNDWINVSAIQPTVYAFIRLLVNNHYLALMGQILISVSTIVAVYWTWRNITSIPMRGIVLVTGVLLATPYAIQYDLVILALALAWYAWDLYENGRILQGEVAILCALFIMPFLNWPIADSFRIQIAPIMLIILLTMALRRTQCLLKRKTQN